VNSSDLTAMAEALCEAVMRHARLYSEEQPDPSQAIPAEVRVAGLASEYRTLARERTGIDPAFGVSDAGKSRTASEVLNLEPDPADVGRSQEGTSSIQHEIFLVDKYFLIIRDSVEFMELARSRLGYLPSSHEEAARLLCEKDGWNSRRYPGDLMEILHREVQVCLG
jgi:hypothetical protein